MSGFVLALSNGFEEITLVLFTTLGPSAAIAYLLMQVPLFSSSLDEAPRARIRKFLWFPLALCMLGLVASATHLGNPANALYVLSRVGVSPLSNEVFAAGAFLALAAVFWLTGFALKRSLMFERVVMIVVTVAGLCFIGAMSFAYDVDTIPTWHSPLVPAASVAGALVGGPLVALTGFALAGWTSGGRRLERAYSFTACVGVAACLCLYAAYGVELSGFQNAQFAAADLVPQYWPAYLVASALLLVSASLPALGAVRNGRSTPLRLTASVLAGFAGIFILRFAFYMAHLTVGLAV